MSVSKFSSQQSKSKRVPYESSGSSLRFLAVLNAQGDKRTEGRSVEGNLVSGRTKERERREVKIVVHTCTT